MTIKHTMFALGLLGLVGCGDKSTASASGAASSSAAPAATSAAPTKPKGKAGSAIAIVGKTTDELEFDVGFVDRLSNRSSIHLFAGCPAMTCKDFTSHKDWVAKCPKGKKVTVQIEDVKKESPIPTGQLAKPKTWIRYMPDPDKQNDLFFDKGFEITKSEGTTVAGKFSLEYTADPAGTSYMQQEGGSLKGDFVAEVCPDT